MENGQFTYDDVMLDWALAELLSATWPWRHSKADELRAKLEEHVALSDSDREWLIKEIATIRDPIIYVYGPQRSWSFRRFRVSREELSCSSIIHHFGYPPSFSFGQLSEKIREDPTPGPIDEPSIREHVQEMLALRSNGQEPFGLPIAIERPASMPPLLIEGYKRAMAALWDGRPSMEIYLCTPRAPTAP
jgi:hypothetical protein